jgi:hypothetical protein
MATERAQLLRPAPERGDTVAAAAVALTVVVSVIEARFESEWGQGIHLVYTAVAALALTAMAAMSPRPGPDDRPAGWQSVLFVTSFVLVLGALTNVADLLGAEDPPFEASGTVVWIGTLLAGLAAWYARGWNSGISTLLCAATLVIVILAFIDWVFSPDEIDTFRWILLLIAAGFGAFGASRRPAEPHHAVGFVNAAGISLFLLAATFLAEVIFGAVAGGFGGVTRSFGPQVGWGWELVVVAGAGLLILYSVVAGQAGPGYLGALNLVAFVLLVGAPGEDGPSLIGWPLVLIIVTGALLVLGFGGRGRPGAGVAARPSPDPGEAPTAVEPRS